MLTVAFVASAVSGVAKGIQWLSNINMVLAIALALFVFVLGPTVLILDLVPTAIGSYGRDLAEMASRTDASGGDAMAKWLSGWTVFYWAWWISWTPFVGMFIARISRGRTIRQFVTGVLLVPSMVTLVWFAIFGGAAIDAQRAAATTATTADDLVSKVGGVASVNFDGVLFQLLDQYPLASVTTVLVMVLVGIFFVSGADAASIVMGTLSERGTIEPSRRTVIFWGVLTGAVAAVMLVAGGTGGDASSALTGLKNITIVSALPFIVVMAGLCVSLVKDLRRDPLMLRAELGTQLMEQAVIAGVAEHGHEDFAIVLEPSEDSDSTRRRGHDRATVGAARLRRCRADAARADPGRNPRRREEAATWSWTGWRPPSLAPVRDRTHPRARIRTPGVRIRAVRRVRSRRRQGRRPAGRGRRRVRRPRPRAPPTRTSPARPAGPPGSGPGSRTRCTGATVRGANRVDSGPRSAKSASARRRSAAIDSASASLRSSDSGVWVCTATWPLGTWCSSTRVQRARNIREEAMA